MDEVKQGIAQMSEELEKFEKDFKELTSSSKASAPIDTLESLLGRVNGKTQMILEEMFQRMLTNELARREARGQSKGQTDVEDQADQPRFLL